MLLTATETVNTTAPGATGNINPVTGIFSVLYIIYVCFYVLSYFQHHNAYLKWLRTL